MCDLFFSIVIPLYNKESTVRDTVLSVLRQSYTSFELIIVNDGSTDKSLDVVTSIKDKRIKIINKINEGVSIARNTGIGCASHDYICFLDADDLWRKNHLATIKYLIDKYPEAGVYATNILYDYGDKKREYFSDLLPENFSDGIIDNYFHTFIHGKSILMPSNTCVKKKVLMHIGLFEPGIDLTEDTDLWCRIAMVYDVAFSSSICEIYRIEDRVPKISRVHYVVESLQARLDCGEVKEKYINDVVLIIQYQLLVSSLFFLLNRNGKASREILRDKRLTCFKRKKAALYFLSFLPHSLVSLLYTKYKRLQ